MNERAFFASMSRNIGDVQMFVGWIIGAVLFTLLFMAGNTMSQSVRDRLSEFGVLKALGFGNTHVWMLIAVESAVLTIVAAVLLMWTFRRLGTNITDTVVTRRQQILVTLGPYR